MHNPCAHAARMPATSSRRATLSSNAAADDDEAACAIPAARSSRCTRSSSWLGMNIASEKKSIMEACTLGGPEQVLDLVTMLPRFFISPHTHSSRRASSLAGHLRSADDDQRDGPCEEPSPHGEKASGKSPASGDPGSALSVLLLLLLLSSSSLLLFESLFFPFTSGIFIISCFYFSFVVWIYFFVYVSYFHASPSIFIFLCTFLSLYILLHRSRVSD